MDSKQLHSLTARLYEAIEPVPRALAGVLEEIERDKMEQIIIPRPPADRAAIAQAQRCDFTHNGSQCVLAFGHPGAAHAMPFANLAELVKQAEPDPGKEKPVSMSRFLQRLKPARTSEEMAAQEAAVLAHAAKLDAAETPADASAKRLALAEARAEHQQQRADDLQVERDRLARDLDALRLEVEAKGGRPKLATLVQLEAERARADRAFETLEQIGAVVSVIPPGLSTTGTDLQHKIREMIYASHPGLVPPVSTGICSCAAGFGECWCKPPCADCQQPYAHGNRSAFQAPELTT